MRGEVQGSVDFAIEHGGLDCCANSNFEPQTEGIRGFSEQMSRIFTAAVLRRLRKKWRNHLTAEITFWQSTQPAWLAEDGKAPCLSIVVRAVQEYMLSQNAR